MRVLTNTMADLNTNTIYVKRAFHPTSTTTHSTQCYVFSLPPSLPFSLCIQILWLELSALKTDPIIQHLTNKIRHSSDFK